MYVLHYKILYKYVQLSILNCVFSLHGKVPVSVSTTPQKNGSGPVGKGKGGKQSSVEDWVKSKKKVIEVPLTPLRSETDFMTATGVIVPSLNLPERNTILNSAHDLGLTHQRLTLCAWTPLKLYYFR